MNTGAKGSRMEGLALQEYKAYTGLPYLKEWRVYRSRRGGNDFLDSFDLALLDSRSGAFRHIVLIQVDDSFRSKRYDELRKLWSGFYGVVCWYAVYASRPKIGYDFETEHFYFIRI